MRYEVTNWIEGHYAALDRFDRKAGHRCFDHTVAALTAGNVEVLKSGMGKSSVGGIEMPSNRMGVNYAINAPTGHLAQGLIDVLFARRPKRNQRLAKDMRMRLERLLALPDEGGWHALTIMGRQLSGLYIIDRDWTRTVLLPQFDPTSERAEAAWSGFLWAARLAHPALFVDMMPHFLQAIATTNRWTGDGISHLGQHLVLALGAPTRRKTLLTFEEGRVALRAASEAVRLEALQFLPSRAPTKDGWDKLIVPFFRDAWPREQEFQTAETTRTLVRFVAGLGERFPAAVSLVADFLVPSSDTSMLVFQFSSDRDSGYADLTARYPLDTLFLLSKIIDDAGERAPYGLAEVLSRLAVAAPELRHDERWQRLHRRTLS